jgi:hypothetical protein
MTLTRRQRPWYQVSNDANHNRCLSPRQRHQQGHLGEYVATGAAHMQPAGVFPVMPAAIDVKAMQPIRCCPPTYFR